MIKNKSVDRGERGERPATTSWPRMGLVMRKALREHKICMQDVYVACRRYMESPADTLPEYRVALDTLPPAFYSFRRNLFSSLFLAVYHMLEIPRARRLLYGRLNQLFRIWVTSADNLLDDEDKVVIPLRMPGQSHVMRQVVTLMAADRVLAELLAEAVGDDVITGQQAERLSVESLRILLPSAAQEATEEGGITERPDPEHVLWTIHRYKTGLLFHIPFLGIDHVETDINREQCTRIRNALMEFGLGCQLLDDVRDMARDLVEARHNYVLSWLANKDPELLERFMRNPPDVGARLYLAVPRLAAATVSRGTEMLRESLLTLSSCGLRMPAQTADRMARSMLTVLDLGDVQYA
jgi:hypothetical protein